MISRISMLVLVSFLSSSAWAYIPPFWMIMSRTAENHGRGPYMIQQEVTFRSGDEPLVVQEIWIVENEQRMRVRISGRRSLKDHLQAVYIYDGGKKYFVDNHGAKKVARVGSDVFEPFFQFRFSKNIKPVMRFMGMIPPSALLEPKKPTPTKLDAAISENESYIRLSRLGGTVSYTIGQPTPVGAAPLPGLWIEQDNFVIKKLRLPSQVEVLADKYTSYPRNLWLPQTRQVKWGDKSALITVTQVKPLEAGAEVKRLLSESSLDFGKDPTISQELPTDETVKDFYTRFR
jgi:hypothetical protein